MKNTKKICIGLVLLATSIWAGVLVSLPVKAAEFTPKSDYQVRNATYEFNPDRGTIVGTFPDDNTRNPKLPGGKLTFKDDDVRDDKYKYQVQYTDTAIDCYGELSFGQDGATNISWGNPPKGISRATVATDIDLATPVLNDDGSILRVNCRNVGSNGQKILRTVENAGILALYFKWEGNTLIPIPPVNATGRFIPFSADKPDIFKHDNGAKCPDIIVLRGGTTATHYQLEGSSDAPPVPTDRFTSLAGLFEPGKCFVKRVNFTDQGNFFELGTRSFTITGTRDINAPITPSEENTNSEDSSCEGSNSSGFEWIFCGALALMDKMVIAIEGQIQELLTFDTNKYLTPQSDIKVAWGVIKNLATVLLVIFMLIMIFSQAVSIGPFDAYTVRKLLPKLVIAVIIMQISWTMLIYFIQLANASGEAIRDLMFAPFGGSSKMQLDDLVGQLGDGTATLSTTAIFTGAVATILFSGITIGGAMLLGLTAVLSVLVGLLVLLLRQMFIIMAVILVPLALVMWILPGTQRYWKLWSDNFVRLLMLFPLIMAMIASGRIFADVAGDTDNLLAVLIIFVGVFGPLWFLPKAFSWGGQLFGAASNLAWNGTKRVRNYPGRYALNMAKENRQFNRTKRAEQLADNTYRFGAAGRAYNSLLAGKYNLARNPGSRERQFENTIAQGRKEAEEAAAREQIGSRYEQLSHEQKLEDLDDRAQGLKGRHSGIDGSSPTARLLALDQLTAFGDWDRITRMRTNRSIPEDVWQRYMAKNVGTVHQQAPHLSPLGSKADLSQIGYEEHAAWKDEGFQELKRAYDSATVRYTGADDPSRGLYRGTMVDVALARGVDPTANPAEAARVREQYRQELRAKSESVLSDAQVHRRLSDSALEVERYIAGGGVAPSPNEVRVTPRGNNQVSVTLPEDLTAPQAQDSIIQHISSGGPEAPQIIVGLAQRIANAPAGSPDEAGFRSLMDTLREQSAASPQARQTYNTLLDRYHSDLEQLAQQAERDALAAGQNAAGIDAATQAAVQHGVEKIDRINTMGANPLERI